MEKRAITDFGYPNLEDVVQIEENVQQRSLPKENLNKI